MQCNASFSLFMLLSVHFTISIIRILILQIWSFWLCSPDSVVWPTTMSERGPSPCAFTAWPQGFANIYRNADDGGEEEGTWTTISYFVNFWRRRSRKLNLGGGLLIVVGSGKVPGLMPLISVQVIELVRALCSKLKVNLIFCFQRTIWFGLVRTCLYPMLYRITVPWESSGSGSSHITFFIVIHS